jgi:signal transduction histidine kinase
VKPLLAANPNQDTNTKRHLQELVVFGLVGSTLIQASAIAFVWGEWSRVLTVFFAWLTMSAINWAITAFAFPRYGSERAEDLRLIPNVVLISIAGHASHWSIAALLFLPFAAVLVGGLQTVRPTGRLVFMVVSISGYALFDQASPVLVACFAGVAIFWHLVGHAHTRFARVMLAEREHNLSALALAHENLKAAQQAAVTNAKLASIGVLAAGVAHEINNPMSFVTANVRGLMEDLHEEAKLSASLVEYRDEILPGTLDGIRRVNAIVADLRRFVRGEPEQPIAFDLATEVDAAVRISRSQLNANQELRVETNETPKVWGMPRQIGQVALNLIVNAINACGDTGSIVVSIGSPGGEAMFAVRDSGAGMSESVLAQLFVPFFTTKEAGKGTGLGLAVAHGIIKAHGGRIAVSSEVGKGTTFEVFLPTSPPAEAPCPASS